MPGEETALDSVIATMGAYMRRHYQPGEFQRAGNTKTHGVVRGEFIDYMRVRGEVKAVRSIPITAPSSAGDARG